MIVTMPINNKICDPIIFLPSRITAIILAIFQGGIIDYYLVKYNSHSWYAWIAGDVAIVFSLFVTFFISYRELKMNLQRSRLPKEDQRDAQLAVDARGFPLIYFAWLVYSVILAVRLAIIYRNFAFKIESDVFFGSNMLQFTLAMSGVMFLLLVTAHHYAIPGTPARNHINLLTGMVPFDIIDCVDILSIFYSKESKEALEPLLEWSVILVACANFVLPIIPLMMLSHSHFGVHKVSPNMTYLQKLIQIFAVNSPLLTIRILLWHKQGENVSPLIVKNIVVIIVLAMDLYEGEKKRSTEEVIDEQGEKIALQRYNNL